VSPRTPLPKAEALREAKAWLRSLTKEEADRRVAGLPAVERGAVRERPPSVPLATLRPYEHPYYWSAFVLIGEPE
jgi:CHAT domain-containing protein